MSPRFATAGIFLVALAAGGGGCAVDGARKEVGDAEHALGHLVVPIRVRTSEAVVGVAIEHAAQRVNGGRAARAGGRAERRACRGGLRRVARIDRGYEAKTAAPHGLNDVLLFAVVTDCLACGVDRATQDVVRRRDPPPERF